MASEDRPRDEAPDQPHPIDPPVSEEERYRLEKDRKEQGGVTEAPLPNNPDTRESDEPALPSKDSSRNTKR